MTAKPSDLLRILLVEDNPGDLVLLRETLREMTAARYELAHVPSLAEAVASLGGDAFDVVLLDLSLPDGKGLGNIGVIAGAARGASIIILTGLDDEFAAVEALRRGAQDYIVKGSVGPDLFWRTMRHAVERKHFEESLHRAREQAEQAARAKSEFLAHISHELRTPLNILLGMAEVLAETELSAAQKKYVEVFRTAGTTLSRIIDDLLDLSKVEAGKLEIESISFDPAGLLEELGRFMQFVAERKGLKFEVRVAPEVPALVLADPQRVRQVLFNLAGNAVKFTERGAVTLGLEVVPEAEGEVLRFSVRDSGIGIAPDKLDEIFEAFTQADGTITRRFGGTGLGLAICRRLVALMGGQIRVTSTPGAGSEFSFTIPCLRPPAGAAVPEAAAPSQVVPVLPEEGEPLDILIVDDAEENRLLLEAFLGRRPFRLRSAVNGAQALAALKERDFKVVLLDMQMPVMDGFECARAIRDWERGENRKRMPLIALTAYSREEDRRRCLEAGCDEFLRKPVQKATLFRLLARVLSGAGVGAPVVKVVLDPLLRELIPGYLDKKRREVGEIRDAAGHGDFSQLQMLGHRMAGTGQSYGFRDITRIGREIEAAAAEREAARVIDLAGQLSGYLEQVEVNYAE